MQHVSAGRVTCAPRDLLRPWKERSGCGKRGAAKASEHGPGEDRLRRGDRRIGISHGSGHGEAALQDYLRLHAEEGRLPQHQISQLADFD